MCIEKSEIKWRTWSVISTILTGYEIVWLIQKGSEIIVVIVMSEISCLVQKHVLLSKNTKDTKDCTVALQKVVLHLYNITGFMETV